jgi:glycosyltransferase involved in cell wall biosynthesis
MRVAVVAEYYPRRRDSVLGVWAHRQAVAARDAGADVRVLALERPLPSAAAVRGGPRRVASELREFRDQPAFEERDGIPVQIVRFVAPPRERGYARWHRWGARPLAAALDRLARDWAIDLVHAHYAVPWAAAARPWASAHYVPLVVSVHGGDLLAPILQSPATRATAGAVLRDAAAVMCNSRATLDRAAALAGRADNMRVVHLGADAPEPLPPKHVQPTVATLGHVIPRKRHVDVLRAVAELPGVRWIVIGDGPELPALRALAADLGVTDRVDFRGQLDHDAALAELARCHLMALPSEDEAFGVAYAEALACGVPAIGLSGEGGPEELASLGDGMVLAPPREPHELALAIRDLLADSEALRALAAAARRTAEARLSWQRCGVETVAVYEQAMAGGSRGRGAAND